MGKIFTGSGWIIRVHGDEHPPIHAHVIHPDGKVVIALDGAVIGSGVPKAIVTQARAWIMANREAVEKEWETMNNPRRR